MPEDPGNPTRGFMKVNLNTGIITFINSNHHLAQAVSEIAFCHEIGHNFGSPHDEPIGGACAPGSASGGNYIMYPKAIYGQMPNNYRFSACSIRNMTNVIVPMLEGTNNRENCLEAYHGPICGNHLVEGGEECDCGYTESECSDKCCYARRNSVNAPGCKLKAGKLCSPSSGPCCTGGCVLSHSTVVCRQETECQEESRCTGLSTDCPAAKNKADYSPCSGGTEVCLKGSCKGSVCLNYSLEGCTLSGSKYSVDAKCLVACHSGGKCRPACEIPEMRAQCGLKMRPGAICDDLRGYCDVFHKCRGIDEKGPLTRLHETLFRFQSLKEYITAHPFLATVYFLTFIALNVLFFHCFALHTPSNNPRRPTRNIVESLRKPANLFKL
ncbi:disintegrin and metalloproteinase domain-containing protein 10-like [Haemaphysalis longicornis]